MKHTLLLALSLPLFAACEGGAHAPAREQVPAGARPQQTAVDRDLAWLAAHQDDDGRWDCDGFMKHDGDAAALCRTVSGSWALDRLRLEQLH